MSVWTKNKNVLVQDKNGVPYYLYGNIKFIWWKYQCISIIRNILNSLKIMMI